MRRMLVLCFISILILIFLLLVSIEIGKIIAIDFLKKEGEKNNEEICICDTYNYDDSYYACWV
jgi:hypothetical protein